MTVAVLLAALFVGLAVAQQPVRVMIFLCVCSSWPFSLTGKQNRTHASRRLSGRLARTRWKSTPPPASRPSLHTPVSESFLSPLPQAASSQVCWPLTNTLHTDDAINLRKYRAEDVFVTTKSGTETLKQNVIELHKQNVAYIISEPSGSCIKTALPPNSV